MNRQANGCIVLLLVKHSSINTLSYTLLPSADTGDCSNGVTVTSNGLLDVPPTSSNVTSTNPVSSEPVYCVWLNLTVITM